MMVRVSYLVLLAALAAAQAPKDLFNKPPTDVDRALRARIAQFYEYHVKEEPRKAEVLVAEDTKDFYYSHNKPHYLSWRIVSIEYSEKYTRAKAMIACKQYVMAPGFAHEP